MTCRTKKSKDYWRAYDNGFEVGMLWQMMVDGEAEIERAIRSDNINAVTEIASTCGYDVEFTDCVVQGWVWLHAQITDMTTPKFAVIDGGLA